jgi:hypothetical protein
VAKIGGLQGEEKDSGSNKGWTFSNRMIEQEEISLDFRYFSVNYVIQLFSFFQTLIQPLILNLHAKSSHLSGAGAGLTPGIL